MHKERQSLHVLCALFLALATSLSPAETPWQSCQKLIARYFIPGYWARKITLLEARLAANPERYWEFRGDFGLDHVAMDDPDFDPVLHDWLKRWREETASAPDALTRAKFSADLIASTFDHSPHRFVRWFRTAHRNLLIGDPIGGGPRSVRLGDLIRIKKANCKDKAALLMVTLREAGITAEMATGYLRVKKPDGTLFQREERHAWVEITVAGKCYVLDPIAPTPDASAMEIPEHEGEPATDYAVIIGHGAGSLTLEYQKWTGEHATSQPQPMLPGLADLLLDFAAFAP
jgi:hypothetical protein